MSKAKHTIAIVDDHLLIAKALTGIVEQFDDYEVIFEAENGQVFQQKFEQVKQKPDLILMDISMPIFDGYQTTEWLTKNHPGVLVLALSMQDDDQSLIKMIRSGARGYLHKNVHPTELLKALDTLISNKYYFPEWANFKILHNLANTDADIPTIELSDREKEFLQYAATELSYKEIGEKMNCSPRTVESYRDSLFDKLNLRTRVGLVVYGMKNKLIN